MDKFHRVFMSFVSKGLGKQNAYVLVFLHYNACMGQYHKWYFFSQKKWFSSILEWYILYQNKNSKKKARIKMESLEIFFIDSFAFHLSPNLQTKRKRCSWVTSLNKAVLPVSSVSIFGSIHTCSIQQKIHCTAWLQLSITDE